MKNSIVNTLKKFLDIETKKLISLLLLLVSSSLLIFSSNNIGIQVVTAIMTLIISDILLGKSTRYYFKIIYKVIATLFIVSMLSTSLLEYDYQVVSIVFGASMFMFFGTLSMAYMNKDLIISKIDQWTQAMLYAIYTSFVFISICLLIDVHNNKWYILLGYPIVLLTYILQIIILKRRKK